MPPRMLMPPDLGIEIIYTITIMLFCFLVYYRTREVYELTKHKGVQFFRFAFIFFGLAYASRLFLYTFMMGEFFLFESFMSPNRMSLMPVSNLMLAYFSSMAILYLIYSTIWRKYSTEHFLTISNIIALVIAVIAFVSRSPMIVAFVQFGMLVVLLTMNIMNHNDEKGSKKTPVYALYFLIAAFWLLSLFVTSSSTMASIQLWVKIALLVFSLGVFIILYYKISRWVR